MTGMADPTTLAALAVGLMTGVGFLLVAVGAEGSGPRGRIRLPRSDAGLRGGNRAAEGIRAWQRIQASLHEPRRRHDDRCD